MKLQPTNGKSDASAKLAVRLLVGVALASMAGYAGILVNNSGLKVMATLCQGYVLAQSFIIIYEKKRHLRDYVRLPVFVFFVFPLARILVDAVLSDTNKAFSDGLIIQGGYYELSTVGLALGLLSIDFSGYALLQKYVTPFFLVGLSLVMLFFSEPTFRVIGFGQRIITNFLFPVALVVLFPYRDKKNFFGWASLFFMFLIAAKISSRSYIIVSCLLSLFLLVSLVRRKNYSQLVAIACLLVLSFNAGLFSFFEERTLIQKSSIIEKFALDSLKDRFDLFLENGDFSTLYYWEGNSRAGILDHAFGSFSTDELWGGRGIFGTYEAFTTRHTLEIGWAQDAFRWGIPYLLVALLVVLYSVRHTSQNLASDPVLMRILWCSITIRLIDGFIYGMPEISVYNLIFFWAVMMPGIRKHPVREYQYAH